MTTSTVRQITLVSFTGLIATASPALSIGSHKVINVKSYGATGNGTTDDTAAIQAALNAAGTNSGNTVYFPAGNYLYSSTLTATGIAIQSQNATLTGTTVGSMLDVGGNNPSITGFTFASNVSANGALTLLSATNPTVANNTFSPKYNIDLRVTLCTGGTITNNNFGVRSAGFGILLNSSNNTIVDSNNVSLASGSTSVYGIYTQNGTGDVISSNTLNGDTASSSNSSRAVFSLESTSVQIKENKINNWTFGISSENDSSAAVTTNTVSNSNSAAILLGGEVGAVATGNLISGVSAGPGILVSGNTGLVTVSQNQISNTGTSGVAAEPISGFGAGGNVSVTGNAIANAGLATATTAVIYVNQTNASAITISGNQYKGSNDNLTYFIDAVQPTSISSVSGNKTNTLLSTKVGP